MRKNLIFVCLSIGILSFAFNNSYGQGGTWVWMNGSQTLNHQGNYGVKGVSSPTNSPPARYQACHWTDAAGNLWMWGGHHFSTSPLGAVYLNDMWKFDVSTEEWTWMHGPQLDALFAGDYGTMGVSVPTNLPPARSFGAARWSDGLGNFYIYSGVGKLGFRGNDLWKYNIALNEWVWIAGSSAMTSAVYGTKGIGNSANTPGSRGECSGGFFFDNKLWLFGGQASTVGNASLDDMWYFDLATQMWTWISGDSSPTNVTGNYGTLGVPDIANYPPAQWNYTRWFGADKNYYLFAGARDAALHRDHLWRFNPTSLEWTWLGGTQSFNGSGISSGACIPDIANLPDSRFESSSTASTKDCASTFYLFGGRDGSGYRNDLWVLNPKTLEWTDIKGSAPSSYGSQGVPSPSNQIPPRGGAAMWKDNSDNLWVYGGFGNGGSLMYADLWKFSLDTTCVNIEGETYSVSWPGNYTICEGDTVRINFLPDFDIEFVPNQAGTYDATTGELVLFPNQTTNYTIKASRDLLTDCPFKDSSTIEISVIQLPNASFSYSPEDGSISTEFSFTNTSTNHTASAWYQDGNLISTDENIQMTFNSEGAFCIDLIASNSCGADSIQHCVNVYSDIFIPSAFSPNADGLNDFFRIIGGDGVRLKTFYVFNRWGQKIFTSTDIQDGWDGTFKNEEVPIGVYFYMIEVELGSESKLYKGDISLFR